MKSLNDKVLHLLNSVGVGGLSVSGYAKECNIQAADVLYLCSIARQAGWGLEIYHQSNIIWSNFEHLGLLKQFNDWYGDNVISGIAVDDIIGDITRQKVVCNEY